MRSNAEKGREFHLKCREALQHVLHRTLDMEISLPLTSDKSHRFDLVSPARDVVAECKAYSFTKSGNPPAAKIVHLREAVQLLKQVRGPSTPFLIIKRDTNPKNGETLAAYFTRLNESMLGSVNILELDEESGELKCLRGKLEVLQKPGSRSEGSNLGEVSVETLGRLRRQIRQILDWREKGRIPSESDAKRVSRLRSLGSLPRSIAGLMHVVLDFRNEAEYEGRRLTEREADTIHSAWDSILEWSKSEGFSPPKEW